MSARLVTSPTSSRELADGCQDNARADEPYRRALRVIRARLTATAAEILGAASASTRSTWACRRMPRRTSCSPTSTSSTRRCAATACGAGRRSAGAAARGVDVFGFHLAAWICGRTPRCTRRSSPSCWPGPGCIRTTRSLPEDERVELLAAELGTRRPLLGAGAQLSELARKELDVLGGRRPRGRALGPAGRAQLRHQHVRVGQRRARGGVLLKEAGLLDASGRRPHCPVGISPLFETIDDLHRGAATLRRDAGPAALPGAGRRPRRHAGGDARLLRLQQGRRIPGGELGAVPRRARPGRGGAQDRNPVAALPRPRRHRRSRRRPQLRGHPGATAGRGEGLAAAHRAGRGHRRQVRRAQIARRNLEALVAATLESTLLDVEGLGDDAEPAYELLDELASLARRAYADLVHETPGFVEYFRASTPVREVGALNIGSRPASRKPTIRSPTCGPSRG